MKLTEVVEILSLSPIPEADKIEKAVVLGWECVVGKELHQIGDKVLFVFPDTIVPKNLLDPSYEGEEKVRIKTIKLRGQYSAGLIVPLKEIGKESACLGEDLSAELGIEKYEKPMPAQLSGVAEGAFPTRLVAKTDEDNYRSNPDAINEFLALGDAEIVGTVKYDGSSMTCLLDENNEFKVCSRNLILKEDENNTFWKIARANNLEEILRSEGRALSIQGEAVGPGIQGNNLCLKEPTMFVFLIRDIDARKWLSWNETVEFCTKHGINHVKEVGRWKGSESNFSELQQLSDQLRYSSNKPAEGIVVRPVLPTISSSLTKTWLSLKVISQPYAKKFE